MGLNKVDLLDLLLTVCTDLVEADVAHHISYCQLILLLIKSHAFETLVLFLR